MSELLYHLTPTPADIPIVTHGNTFWRDGERFFIKGISYRPRKPDSEPYGHSSLLDPLTNDRLPELKKDIALLHELGLNSISVGGLTPDQDHSEAFRLLEKAGIYVMVTIFGNLNVPEAPPGTRDFDEDFDTSLCYDSLQIADNLRLVDQLSHHPNILGFVVSGDCLNKPAVTKIAEVMRACVRDTKAFLHARGGRQVPVGVSTNDLMQIAVPQLQYFSAGDTSERVNFYAHDSWSWAGKSSFRISGWQNLVGKFCKASKVPMILSAYGTNIYKPRVWDEVLCLYSPEMTATHSGGFAYTLIETGNGYGAVSIGKDGERNKEQDFMNLKKKYGVVNCRLSEELAGSEVAEYDGWVGAFPECSSRWRATSAIPAFSGGWDEPVRSAITRPERSSPKTLTVRLRSEQSKP